MIPVASVEPQLPTERLAQVIRDRITTGGYRPGAWIREAELQREFGLSNGPVREALQNVVGDGLAERAPFRGVRVIDLTEQELVELFEVRTALLGFAAELAAERGGSDVARSAAALKSRMSEAPHDGAADFWLAGELSQWVFALAGNARLREAYRRPLLQSLVYISVVRKGTQSAALLRFALRLIDAIAAGQRTKARRAVHDLSAQTLAHLRTTQESTK
jgi:DNA-binding GntR family transcriptional regulator